jgi:hypothetical protein
MEANQKKSCENCAIKCPIKNLWDKCECLSWRPIKEKGEGRGNEKKT